MSAMKYFTMAGIKGASQDEGGEAIELEQQCFQSGVKVFCTIQTAMSFIVLFLLNRLTVMQTPPQNGSLMYRARLHTY